MKNIFFAILCGIFLLCHSYVAQAVCVGETSTTTELGLCITSTSASSANLFNNMDHNWQAIDASSVGIQAPADGGTGAGQFTLGSMPYVGANGVYQQNNSAFFFDATPERLGLGTTSPTGVLDVQTTNASEIVAVFGGAASPTTDLLRVQQAGVNRFSIDENAQVGIWTPNPTARLHITGENTANDDDAIRVETSPNALLWTHSNTNRRSSLGNASAGGAPYICLHCEHSTTANTWRNDDDSAAGTLILSQSGQLDFVMNAVSTSADEFSLISEGAVLTLENTGEVGINNETPGEALDVVGQIQLSDLTAPGADPMCWDGTGTSTIGDCTSLRKYKTEIEDLPEEMGLPTVLKMRPRTFTWSADMGGKADLGFVAEEVEEVNPLIASYTDKGLSGVKFGHYTATLTKAIQQQQAMIDQQINLIQGMTARIDALETISQ